MERTYPQGTSFADQRHIDAIDAIRSSLRAELPDRDSQAWEDRDYQVLDARVGDFDVWLSRARVEISELALSGNERSMLKLRAILRDDLEGRHSSEDEQLVDEAVETVIEALENMRMVVELGSIPISELESEGLETERLQIADGAVPIEPPLDEPHSRGVLGE